MYTTEKITPDNFVPAHFESEGVIELQGEKVPYHTICEDNPFYDKNGKAVASFFSYSYFRSDVGDVTNRPVLFGFNGGPGSSSMYVHAGFLGVKRLKYPDVPDRETALPPYEAIDNPNCFLDFADIVLVDPVAVGYGMLIDEDKAEDFFGVEQDAEAFLCFIEDWLNRYQRWGSPKYLIGESYGCTRAAIAAGISVMGGKERCYNVVFDGLVLIGNTVTTGKYFGKELPVENSVWALPSYAAINWYHNHPSDQSVEAFFHEAKDWADTEYLLALHKGNRLQGEERKAIIAKLMYYTGMSEEYLEARDLKIDDESFRQEVAKNKGVSVGRYDGRLTRPRYVPETVEKKTGVWADASDDRYNAFFYTVATHELFPLLNIQLDRPFISFYNMFDEKDKKHKWDPKESMGNTSEQLYNAMLRTPGMRTFFASGYYDTATHMGLVYYTLDHCGIPKERTCVKGYRSGHMIYIGEDNVKELTDDIRDFIHGGMPSND